MKRLKVYATMADISLHRGWGSETYWQWNKQGDLLKGPPISRRKLPGTLYHMTTNLPAVRRSGFLRGSRGEGGLGGSQHTPVVSLTLSQGIARSLATDLKRAIGFARGKTKLPALRHIARRDERVAGLKRGTLNSAVKFAFHNYKGNVTSPGYRTKTKKHYLAFEAFKSYLQIRESKGGFENPLFFGGSRSYARMKASRVGVVKVPKRGIPVKALVHKYVAGRSHPLLEVRVAADVGISRKSSTRVRGHRAQGMKGVHFVKMHTRRLR